jgi:hypothetical protein
MTNNHEASDTPVFFFAEGVRNLGRKGDLRGNHHSLFAKCHRTKHECGFAGHNE